MKKQAGITLLEVVIALGIMSVVVAGTAALIDRAGADTRAAVAAQQLKTVGDAANAYIKDNYTAVVANATATTPALIRVSDLVAGGYLTTGATAANAYQQNQCVLVLEPTANNLTALVVTEGGTAIDDLTLGGVASLIGAAGGGIYSTATTTVRGAMGGWSIATGNYANANHLGQHCDGTAGIVTLAAGHPAVALWFANGNITSGYLYRAAVPGHPELNQMQTTLDMNGNAISNAATVQLNTVVTSGTACTTNGVLARDANGAVMSCQSLQWKSQGSAYWQDPVANFASLPACTAAIAWQTRVAQTPTVGTGPRAYTCNGAAWQALAVDNNGNIVASRGQFSRDGAVPCCGDTGTLSLAENTTTTGRTANISLHNGGIHEGNIELAATGTRRIRMYDNQGQTMGLELTGNLQMNRVETEGAGCSPNGLVARDSVGLILSCQSGVWAKASGSSSVLAGALCGRAVNDTMWGGGWQSFANCNGSPVWASCPVGYTNKAVGYDQYSGAVNYFYSCVKN